MGGEKENGVEKVEPGMEEEWGRMGKREWGSGEEEKKGVGKDEWEERRQISMYMQHAQARRPRIGLCPTTE